jgi:hypothetical protein
MKLQFTEQDWQRIEEDYTAWWAGELDRPLLYAGDCGPTLSRMGGIMANWPEMSDDELVDTVWRIACEHRYRGDSFPTLFINYGPGVAAVFTGASLHAVPGTVWYEPPEKHELDGLTIRLDRDNPWWQRIYHQTALLSERLGDRMAISFTDIGGNLDILASLRTTESLLLDLAMEPSTVKRLTEEITDMWLEVYDALDAVIRPHCRGTVPWGKTWGKGRGYMLQSDFAYMISPEMFAEYVVPDLTKCCDAMDHGFYHLDGVGQLPHLDHLLGIESLRGIQWIPGAGKPNAAVWDDVIGPILEGGKLVQAAGTPDEVLAAIKRHGGKGIQFMLSQGEMSDSEFDKFLDEVRRV